MFVLLLCALHTPCKVLLVLLIQEPVSILLGTNWTTKGSGLRRRARKKKHEMIYVPILKTLEMLLQNKAFQQEVCYMYVHVNVYVGKCHLCQLQIQDDHKSSDGFIRDYCDGEAYPSHPLFSVRRGCLELILYYDDVEICNPLGSRRCKHKIGE